VRLAGKIAVITGGASGIGAAIAAAFEAQGAYVTIADTAVGAGDGDAWDALNVDVTDEHAVTALLADILERHGRIDVLVNSAGIDGALTRLENSTSDNFDAVLAVNLRGTFLCMKHALRPMREAGAGSIVNVASTAGLVGMPALGAYSASKGGVVQLTRSAALDYARAGVRVNAICPGPINTPIAQRERERNPAATAALEERVPVGRFGEPAEVADAAVFLASDESRYITGIALPVDGGLTAA
jgi:NAD(P)-dependent dehydrogenase (short-subunit alcohol dehydrogenase family)